MIFLKTHAVACKDQKLIDRIQQEIDFHNEGFGIGKK